ncbi:AraC family transcriptional regulator [Enterocloster bolteae]|uniref:AraC family transcriptional regulator n=1 Tax=Enterocloster bolteae TaxID=208479 RepID=UPI001D06AE99|nr:AraC family transcriptional regulator [Enterocloster bolteae]MCB6924238.1 AraC family transcriptional regulator [Enterocloster bolteae]MCQ4757978.1 AraC family transcriptional regulator [Enterocloster bolteae]
MNQEFEIISHSQMNFKLFLVNMLYRTPHIHKDFELCLLLDGSLFLQAQNETHSLETGDFFVVNPFQSHELKADSPALLVSLQVHPSFFSSYYPRIANLEFTSLILQRDGTDVCKKLYDMMIELACLYLKKADKFELKCVGLLNLLFAGLLDTLPNRLLSDKEKNASQSKASRMRKITHYIDEHYSEKLLLSDIARKEDLSLTYLSHFFKDYLGLPFQEYLAKIRCEKARQLLLLTDFPLLDICMSCGFSDSKYFNSGFRRQYGCSPKEYRQNFRHDELKQQQKSMLTTQEFLSASSSIVLLERCLLPQPAGPAACS